MDLFTASSSSDSWSNPEYFDGAEWQDFYHATTNLMRFRMYLTHAVGSIK